MTAQETLTGEESEFASITERAMHALTRAIHDGVYSPGQRLTEIQLSRELGISRGSLREIFRRLAARGLIEQEPNRGAVVKRISRETVMNILATREVLEGLAASLAAQQVAEPGNRGKVEAMKEAIAASQKTPEGFDFMEDNTRFHDFIIELSANDVLQMQIEQLQLPGIRSRFFSQISLTAWESSLYEHRAILDAILDGDAAFAEQLMRAHVRKARKHFAELPAALFDCE